MKKIINFKKFEAENLEHDDKDIVWVPEKDKISLEDELLVRETHDFDEYFQDLADVGFKCKAIINKRYVWDPKKKLLDSLIIDGYLEGNYKDYIEVVELIKICSDRIVEKGYVLENTEIELKQTNGNEDLHDSPSIYFHLYFFKE